MTEITTRGTRFIESLQIAAMTGRTGVLNSIDISVMQISSEDQGMRITRRVDFVRTGLLPAHSMALETGGLPSLASFQIQSVTFTAIAFGPLSTMAMGHPLEIGDVTGNISQLRFFVTAC